MISARNEPHSLILSQLMPTSTIITSLLYRLIISFMLAKHCVLMVAQSVAVGYIDMPITSYLALLVFNPSNIHLNKVLLYPLEICTITFAEGKTDFTASYPALMSCAKLLMLLEAWPSGHNMPSFVSLPVCTHSGLMLLFFN